MTFVVQRQPAPTAAPVHVLIVMVGNYLDKSANLQGAATFAQAIVDFWRTLPVSSFPSAQALVSIEVLASDSSGAVSIVGDNGPVGVDRPTFDAAKTALLGWARRVKAEGGIGFLHWVGHGMEQIKGGSIVSLACDGARDDGAGQAGLDWTCTLHVINGMTDGQPVYCFIDACRSPDRSDLGFEGIGPPNWSAGDNACVFFSTARGKKAFWIVTPKPAALNAGCGKHALGTQAFIAALKGFGARLPDDPAAIQVPIVAAELVQASQALVARWARHQQISPPPGDPAGPSGRRPDAILLTDEPKCTVDVFAKGVASPTDCEALAGSPPPLASETASVPFEFRLARKPHKFRFNSQNWDPEKLLLHPHMELYK
ncbi:hypothetical protein [Bradyrhizobium sp. SZCCHNS3053]|uniref:hypothetical protein n=1 Tax=Bradyrhizobium sp. SZCCHNS3053 TaxID=3057322 RepID=UPI00291625BD|nr:hypothetical protein [Bradyrhizobium sp. SZCCHNS3053]